MNKNKAIILGGTGQDGSYLSEILLQKGYTVIGVSRRSSTDTTSRIKHLLNSPNFTYIEGDVTDPSCVNRIIEKYDPQEIYNLAAQSHVSTSFEQPKLTWDVVAGGCLNILEGIRAHHNKIKFYQASSSEMFGKNFTTAGSTKWQDENTPFAPQSPYAIAKLAAHHLVRNYRESYGIFGCSGILMNHECFKYDYPFIIKKDGIISIDSIEDIAKKYAGFDSTSDNKSGTKILDLEVWDINGWTKIKYISWFKNQNKKLKIVNARNAVYSISDDHVCILENNNETKNIKIGDKIKKINYPPTNIITNNVSLEEAELLGMLVGDGSLSSSEQFTNKNEKIRDRFSFLWTEVTGGSTRYYPSVSGFTGNIVGRLDLLGGKDFVQKVRKEIYSESVDIFGHKYKKIPDRILNSTQDVMEAFLIGYNICDGLKKNTCTYLFKNFKTNSPILAAGLLYLINIVTGQRYNITIEESWKHGKQQFYYSMNLLTHRSTAITKYGIVKTKLDYGMSMRAINRETGYNRGFIKKIKRGYKPQNTHHNELCNLEVKKIIEIPDYKGWFFDLETESGTIHAGIGQGLVHNSPRRGEQFVTRKITKWIGQYKNFLSRCTINYGGTTPCPSNMLNNSGDNISIGSMSFPKLRLGNIYSYRDWGHAKDYCNAMHLMMQQDNPDDFVISTGEAHSVEQFLDKAFYYAGLGSYKDHIIIDKAFFRPSEVDYLRGDCRKAKTVLGWQPFYTFNKLVEEMVSYDIDNA